ncbi:OmpA family protein, partial [Salinarimonas sp. NSM]|uniref:OmpA family protein n=1 Tax=Salinarimonas sp. NSM TaxID=3458003 RepID=UPI004036BAD2
AVAGAAAVPVAALAIDGPPADAVAADAVAETDVETDADPAAEPEPVRIAAADEETPAGEVVAEDAPTDGESPAEAPVAAEAVDPALARAAALRARIAAAMAQATGAAVPENAPAIEVSATSEGLLVSLTDDADFGMFAIGSAEPRPELVRVVEEIAPILAEEAGAIVIRGHTDARPFSSATYDNWRLSSARAHMAYYMLVRGGFAEERILRVEGHADRMLKVADDPYADENRRIEILLREARS